MGNTLKLVSGFILFVVGVLIAYETTVYNLVNILLMVGLVIAVVGIILVVSYFVDINSDRTTNAIKDLINNTEGSSPFDRFEKRSNTQNQPLNLRRREFNEYDDVDYDELVFDDYQESIPKGYHEEFFEDNPKAVLNVAPVEERDYDFDRQLTFTPHYDKPIKVTRSPKRRQENYFTNDVPEFVIETEKSEEIKKALSQEEPEAPVIETPAPTPIAQELNEPRDIKIDINNPESLPVPKLLQSYVIYDDGLVTSQDAFDQLAVHVNKEIMLEIPSLNDLSDRFLSHVPTIYSRVIIDEFDVSDMSYMFLISSLLKQGVHIRTVPKVHTVNLITDDSHAMIISDNADGIEYGAIYDDRNSISNIRADFEKTWDIASNLDESIVMPSVGGTA